MHNWSPAPLSPETPVRRFIFWLCGASLVWTVAILGLTILATPLMFDEGVNTHLLWLVSIGRVPHVDFFCHYPAAGYVIAAPYFRLFPETIYSVLALRFFSAILFLGAAGVLLYQARGLKVEWFWGLLTLALITLSADLRYHVIEFRNDGAAALAALLALAVMFREPTPRRFALAAGLSAFSLVIMPKYVYPLVLAGLFYLAYGCFRLKRMKQTILAAGVGIFLALALSHLLLAAVGTTLWEDLYWSQVLMMRFMSHLVHTRPEGVPGTWAGIVGYFARYWWIGLILLIAVTGWFAAEIRKREVRLWTGGAMLAGVILSWAAGIFPHRQYFTPGLFCLVLFSPYLGRLPGPKAVRAVAALLLAALLVWMNVVVTREATAELLQGTVTEEGARHSLSDFAARQEFLDLIPRGERVVGCCYSHPIFREDQTPVTYDADGGVPKGFLPLIPAGTPAWEYFQPGYLARSLESAPPASIAHPCNFYPSGWNRVLSEFLERNPDRYRLLNLEFGRVYIRNDLLPGSVPAGD